MQELLLNPRMIAGYLLVLAAILMMLYEVSRKDWGRRNNDNQEQD